MQNRRILIRGMESPHASFKYEISSDEEMDEIPPDVLHVMQYAAIQIQFTLREHKNSHSFGLKMHQICINENDMQQNTKKVYLFSHF